MSDNQKATSSLNLLVESCKAALIALSEEPDAHEDHPSTEFATLRIDFLSLLSLLYAASTKVALSLKPSLPQYKASLVPLKDLSNNVAAVVHSIRLMRRTQGATVLSEYENVTRNVISSIEYFAQSFLAHSSTNTNSEDYLVGVGKVHELIDAAKQPGGLSLNNRDAVQKKWLQDHESLVDGAEEIQEIGKPADADGMEDDEDFDDGWSELGLSSKQVLSPAEKDRTVKVQAFVKLTILLHKRVISAVLSAEAPTRDDATLDKLAALSAKLPPASDDLISSMYAPQEPSTIAPYLSAFSSVLKDLRKILIPPGPQDLDKQLEALSLGSKTTDKSTRWFLTCFEQLDKACMKVEETLVDAEGS